jgi:hypothetical protein
MPVEQVDPKEGLATSRHLADKCILLGMVFLVPSDMGC